MVAETIPQLRSLSLTKKRRLIAELVSEVFGEEVQDADLAKALAARLEHHRNDRQSGQTWAEVKARLRKKK